MSKAFLFVTVLCMYMSLRGLQISHQAYDQETLYLKCFNKIVFFCFLGCSVLSYLLYFFLKRERERRERVGGGERREETERGEGQGKNRREGEGERERDMVRVIARGLGQHAKPASDCCLLAAEATC